MLARPWGEGCECLFCVSKMREKLKHREFHLAKRNYVLQKGEGEVHFEKGDQRVQNQVQSGYRSG